MKPALDSFADENAYQQLVERMERSHGGLFDVRVNIPRAVSILCAKIKADFSRLRGRDIEVEYSRFECLDSGSRAQLVSHVRTALAAMAKEGGYTGDRVHVLDFSTLRAIHTHALLEPLIEFEREFASVMHGARGAVIFVPPIAEAEQLFKIPSVYWRRVGEHDLSISTKGLPPLQLGARRAYLRSFFATSGNAALSTSGDIAATVDLTDLAARAVLEDSRERAFELLERARQQYADRATTHGPDLCEAEYRLAAALLWFDEDLKRATQVLRAALRRAGDEQLERRRDRGQILQGEVHLALGEFELASVYFSEPRPLPSGRTTPRSLASLDRARAAPRRALCDYHRGALVSATEEIDQALDAWRMVEEEHRPLSLWHTCERAAVHRLGVAITDLSGDRLRHAHWSAALHEQRARLATHNVDIDA